MSDGLVHIGSREGRATRERREGRGRPEWLRIRLATPGQYHKVRELVVALEPPHRLPGGALPEHLRVLGRARHRDLHDPGRRLHPPLRLLRRHLRSAAARRRSRGAGARGRGGGGHGAEARGRHLGRPRRPAGRRRPPLRPGHRGHPPRATRAPRSRCSPPTSAACPTRSTWCSRAAPEVFSHNVETVPRLYRAARPGSRYDRSLGAPGRGRAAPRRRLLVRPRQDRHHGGHRRDGPRRSRRRSPTSAAPGSRSSPSASTCSPRPGTCPSTAGSTPRSSRPTALMPWRSASRTARRGRWSGAATTPTSTWRPPPRSTRPSQPSPRRRPRSPRRADPSSLLHRSPPSGGRLRAGGCPASSSRSHCLT